jgi:Flp pilus assembly pilin Flp
MVSFMPARRAISSVLRDERGQVLVEKAVLVAFFTILILSTMKYVVDGLVSFYAYVTAFVCLPIP